MWTAQISDAKLLLLSILIASVVFTFDLLLPLGVAAGVPYVALVLLGMWARKTPYVFLLAAAGSVLIVLGYLFSATGGVPWVVLTNRGLAFFIIWSTAMLVAHRKQGQDALEQANAELEERVLQRTAELHESEQHFRDLVEGSSQGIVIHHDFELLLVNQAFADIMGFNSVDEILSLDDILQCYPEHERQRLRRIDAARQAGEEAPSEFEVEAVRRDGAILWLNVRVRFIDWHGQAASQATFTDITERKLTRDQLRERETLYTTILDNTPATISLKAPDGRYLFVNKIFAERRGISMEEIRGKTAADLWPPEIAKNLLAEDAELLRTRAVVQSETDSLGADGVLRRYRGVKFPVFDSDGEVVAYGAVHNDISKQIESEMNAARQAALVTALIDTLPAHISLRDREGKYIFVNRTMAEDYGRNKSEFVGRTLYEVDRPTKVPSLQTMAEEVLKTDEPILNREFHPPRFPGRTFLSSILPMHLEDGAVEDVLAISLDITDRKQAEEALRDSEKRFAGILDISSEAVISVGEDLRINLFNQGAVDIFGYDADEVMGQPVDILLPMRFRDKHDEHIRRFAQSGMVSRLMGQRGEVAGLRKDGSDFPAEAAISQLSIGEEKTFTVTLRDISDRTRAEAQRAEALEEAENANRAKTEFLASVSHELRTPLNAVIGFSDMMQQEIFGPLGDAHYREYADAIHDSGEHLLALISDILDISTIEAGKVSLNKEMLGVKEVAAECANIVANSAKTKGLAIKTEISEDLPPIYADRRAMRQILLNLLSNAIKFTPEEGRITLRAQASDDSMVLKVADTGPGIPAEKLPELTEPFTRLERDRNESIEGWGLGLAITKSLIELHGGVLDIESEVGEGTTVTVTIPNIAP